jgi:rare lipoprotein A
MNAGLHMTDQRKSMRIVLAATIAAAVLAAGCGPGDDEAETLSEEEIAALIAEHPRLSDQPLPEPEPNGDADPDDVPDHVRDHLDNAVLERVTGGATFYADYFEGRRTASGIPFRQNQMVAAHRAYPFGTVVRVTNLRNERSVNVKVVDRGPFGPAATRATIDLSRRAAQQLNIIQAGRAQVQIEVLEWGSGVPGAVS